MRENCSCVADKRRNSGAMQWDRGGRTMAGSERFCYVAAERLICNFGKR